MDPRAFVYTELQISVPFSDAPWSDVNKTLLEQPGLLNKTWLAGVNTNSLGGFYTFDSIDNAKGFVTGYFPSEAARFGATQTTRIFAADPVADASLDIGSVHFGTKPSRKPGAFVYTELQAAIPFAKAPWRERNPVLRQIPGLQSKTWLSGLNTQTLGGLDAFDTVESAARFALEAFPKTAASLGAAFIARIFDAGGVEAASREMSSPFFV